MAFVAYNNPVLTTLSSSVLEGEEILKTLLGKGKKLCYPEFSPFPTLFSTQIKDKSDFFSHKCLHFERV